MHTQSSNKEHISPQPSSNNFMHHVLQYSARRRHIVKRTYDSSDDYAADFTYDIESDAGSDAAASPETKRS